MKHLLFRHAELVSASHKIDKILKQVQKDGKNVFINQYFNNRTQVSKKIASLWSQ